MKVNTFGSVKSCFLNILHIWTEIEILEYSILFGVFCAKEFKYFARLSTTRVLLAALNIPVVLSFYHKYVYVLDISIIYPALYISIFLVQFESYKHFK